MAQTSHMAGLGPTPGQILATIALALVGTSVAPTWPVRMDAYSVMEKPWCPVAGPEMTWAIIIVIFADVREVAFSCAR
eukprot:6478091-Amphidinium_carterae.1